MPYNNKRNDYAFDFLDCLGAHRYRRSKLGIGGLVYFDLVAAVFGQMTPLSRLVYALVGVSAAVLLILSASKRADRPAALRQA